jgi:iron complex transport system permease protein
VKAPAHRTFTPGRLAGLLTLMGLLFLLCAGWALTVGSTQIDLLNALRFPTSRDAEILVAIRLPWVVLATAVGLALSASGAAFQGLLRNPLADPYLLGMSGGASLGVVLAFTVGGALQAVTPFAVPLFGFAGALFATALVWRLSHVGGETNAYTMLLAGVVVNAVFSAVIMFVVSISRPEEVHRTALWLMGILDVFLVSRPLLYGTGVVALIGVALLCSLGKHLNALSLGEETAHHLGTNVKRARAGVFFASALLVGSATAVAGPIGFVGLLVPHLVRMFTGPDHRVLIAASAIGGAIFLLLAGSLARMAFPLTSSQIPVGVVTACLGGPFFLWLLRARGKRWG